MENNLKIGDKVEIVKHGEKYSRFSMMFDYLEFKNKYLNNKMFSHGIIFACGYHPNTADRLYAVRDINSDDEILISQEGIKKIENSNSDLKLIVENTDWGFRYYIIYKNGIGLAQLSLYTDETSILLHDFIIDPICRNRQHGQTMLKLIEDYVKNDLMIDKIKLVAKSKKLIDWYESFDYKIESTDYLMCKNL